MYMPGIIKESPRIPTVMGFNRDSIVNEQR
jgi:hypothetical protein